MRTKAVFTEVETLLCRDSFRYVSPLALEIHVRAVARSVRSANPAFISDTGLNAIAPGNVTTLAAAELCIAGVWHRAENGYGGYVITDDELIGHLAEWSLVRRIKGAWNRWWLD